MNKKLLKEIESVANSLSGKYKTVEIVWLDPSSVPSWQDTDFVLKFIPNICVSRGFLVEENENFLIMATHLSASFTENSMCCGQVGDVFTIPINSVIKKRFIKE